MVNTFDTGIPAVKTPLFYANISKTNTNFDPACCAALLIGPATSGAAEQVACVNSEAEGIALAGAGSFLASMISHYYLNNGEGQLCVLPVADAAGSTAASLNLDFSGSTATEGGVIPINVGAYGVNNVPVAIGDTHLTIAAAFTALINGDSNELVSAVDNADGTVTLTAKNAGTLGNDIAVAVGNLPAGVSVNGTGFLAGGAVDADLQAALASIGDCQYCYIGSAFYDLTNLGYFKDFLAARWEYNQLNFGMAFTAHPRDTHGNLLTYAQSPNSQHISVTHSNCTDSPSFDIVGALTGVIQNAVCQDPAANLQFTSLNGVGCTDSCAVDSDCFNFEEGELLLNNGMTTLQCGADGLAQIVRLRTTFLTDSIGNPCEVYEDAISLFTIQGIIERLNIFVLSRFSQVKLFNNSVELEGRGKATTPNLIKGAILQFFEDELQGFLADDVAEFKQSLVVERDDSDANRINICFDVNLANQLIIVAVKMQPRLN